jgi:hypothetical protein
MNVAGQKSIQGDTEIFRVLNMLNLRGSKLYVQCSVSICMYLDRKHMIWSCLDLVAITSMEVLVQIFKINFRIRLAIRK